MKRLINTQDVKETLFREEEELAKTLFASESYPIGFITGVQEAMNIVNTSYKSHSYLVDAICELAGRLLNMKDSVIKCGYYFIMSYLHYLENNLALSLMATECIIACYNKVVSDND